MKRGIIVVATAVLPLVLLWLWGEGRLMAQVGAPVVIEAVYYDGIASGEPDEAVRIRNVTDIPFDLSGWQLTDGEATAVLPDGVLLGSGDAIWLARNGVAFRQQFGFLPDFELQESDPAVPNLSGGWTGLGNSGDQVMLLNAADLLIDCLPYKGNYNGECGTGWSGPVVQPYTVGGVFGAEGQILFRKLDAPTGFPLADTNTAVDWAQEPSDPINGRKVQYPGWDTVTFARPLVVTETAVLTIAVAPDNAYHALLNQLNGARHSIDIETHTFENVAIAEALIDAEYRGVDVTVLLEGAPSGGLPDQEKYNCQRLEAAGGACWFMISDDDLDIADRYRFLHAKFVLIDGQRVIIGSENLSPNSLPSDDKADGTWGRRGVLLMTDAPGVVGHVQAIWARDFDPATHWDLFRWQAAHPVYGAPPAGFSPILETGGVTYTVRFPEPVAFQGVFPFEIVQAPENALLPSAGLLGLLGRAVAGDTVLVQQLSERPYWGSSNSNPADDPNLRLEGMLEAARRGATVRLLLDDLFEDGAPNGNAATCSYVNKIAQNEQLDLWCQQANPSGLGIHNKMVLVELNGQGFVHVGSWNGTEQSSKGNREVALQVQSNQAYAYLAAMFEKDWPRTIYLPLFLADYQQPVDYLLISEFLYNPNGPDDAEFVEIVNPGNTAVSLANYSLSDAVNPTDFEDLRRFPPGTTLGPGQVLVVALTATGFEAEFGRLPDFEMVETNTAVANLIDDPAWGDPNAFFQLGNSGDEVILRNPQGVIVDAVAYGSGAIPGVIGCDLLPGPNQSYERFPYDQDRNSCPVDFRPWLFPNPGELP